MTLAYAAPPNPDSMLSRLDARWRLAGLGCWVAATACLQTLPASGAALAISLLLALLARLPAHWLLGRLAGSAPFLLFFIVLTPFCVRDPEPLFAWGPLTLSQRGLTLAALIGLKAVTILIVVLVLLATAPLHATLHAAHRLRVPGLLIQLTLLSYRYIFLIASEFDRLRTALRTRGFRNRLNMHSYRTVAHVSGTLLVRSHERAERVGQAMRCRGFAGQFRALAEFRTTAADVLVFVSLVIAAAALLAWDRAGGW